MPNVTTEPDVLQQEKLERLNKILEYAPLVKSIAAVGVGAFGGESGKTRGITRGLVNSAENDIKARQLADIARREQTEKDIKARQAKLKETFDITYKISTGIDDSYTRMLYNKNTGLLALGKELYGSQFMLEATDAHPKPAMFDVDFFEAEIDAIQDKNVKADALFYLHNAIAAKTEQERRLNYESMREVMEPKPESYYRPGSIVPEFFRTQIEAEKAGAIYKEPQGDKDKDANDDQKVTVNALISKANSTSGKINTLLNKIDDGFFDATVDIREMIRQGAAEQKKLLHATRNGDFNPLRVDSPAPGYIEGSYEIIAAAQVLDELDREFKEAGKQEEHSITTGPVIKTMLKLNKDRILQVAEELRAADEGREPVDVSKSLGADTQTGTPIPSRGQEAINKDAIEWLRDPANKDNPMYEDVLAKIRLTQPTFKP